MGEGRIRAFLALPTPDDLRVRIASLGRHLATSMPGLRLVPPGGIHLTLCFLGSASAEQLDAVGQGVLGAAAACPRGEARVEGLGLFPVRGAPRILWIGVRLPTAVLDLQRACEAAATAAGFPREDRPFRPHLTLGRWKERARRPELPPGPALALPCHELVLFRSEPRAGGSVYTALRRFPLEG